MPYTLRLVEFGPWYAVEFDGVVGEVELLTARTALAERNRDGTIDRFILDFSRVREFVLSVETAGAIHRIDAERKTTLPEGRCALVASRDLIEYAATYLATVSPLNLDFRLFRERAQAEAWLRGELATPPPPPPRRP